MTFLSPNSTPRSTPRSTPARSMSPLSLHLSINSSNHRQRRHRFAAPKFYSVPHNRVCEEGETVRFQCAIAGHPIPWSTWDKDGIIVTPSTRYTIKERDDMRYLEIEEVCFEDAGKITIFLGLLSSLYTYKTTLNLEHLQDCIESLWRMTTVVLKRRHDLILSRVKGRRRKEFELLVHRLVTREVFRVVLWATAQKSVVEWRFLRKLEHRPFLRKRQFITMVMTLPAVNAYQSLSMKTKSFLRLKMLKHMMLGSIR